MPAFNQRAAADRRRRSEGETDPPDGPGHSARIYGLEVSTSASRRSAGQPDVSSAIEDV